MGQTLANRPVSQRSSFATLTGSSNPMAPSQPQASPAPPPDQPMPTQPDPIQGQGGPQQGGGFMNPSLQGFQTPSVLGGLRFGGISPRYGGPIMPANRGMD